MNHKEPKTVKVTPLKAIAIRLAAAMVRTGQAAASTPRQFRAIVRNVIAAAHLEAAA